MSDDVHRSAMVLTAEEWEALRGVALYFLDHAVPDDVQSDLCERIVEATA